jgi:hypothetical protein
MSHTHSNASPAASISRRGPPPATPTRKLGHVALVHLTGGGELAEHVVDALRELGGGLQGREGGAQLLAEVGEARDVHEEHGPARGDGQRRRGHRAQLQQHVTHARGQERALGLAQLLLGLQLAQLVLQRQLAHDLATRPPGLLAPDRVPALAEELRLGVGHPERVVLLGVLRIRLGAPLARDREARKHAGKHLAAAGARAKSLDVERRCSTGGPRGEEPTGRIARDREERLRDTRRRAEGRAHGGGRKLRSGRAERWVEEVCARGKRCGCRVWESARARNRRRATPRRRASPGDGRPMQNRCQRNPL